MWAQDEYVKQQLHKDTYDRLFQEAETLRKLRQAGLLKTRAFPKLACRSLACLGRALVALGRRLEQMESAPTPV